MFFIIIRINGNHFSKQHYPSDICNGVIFLEVGTEILNIILMNIGNQQVKCRGSLPFLRDSAMNSFSPSEDEYSCLLSDVL